MTSTATLITLLAAVVLLSGLVVFRFWRQAERSARAQQLEHEKAVGGLQGLLDGMARAQSEIQFQARLLNAVGQAVLAVDLDGNVVYCNRAAAGMFACSAEEAIGKTLSAVVRDADTGSADAALARLAMGQEWSGELAIRRADGSVLPIMATDAPIHDESGKLIGMVRIAADLTTRKHSELATRLLADASAALSASLDYSATVRAVARLALPALAEGCVVDVVGDDGRMWRIEAANISEEKERLAREIRQRYPLTLDARHPISEVIRTGRPQLFPQVKDGLLRSIARDEEHLRTLRQLSYRSAMIVPLVSGGQTFGAISFFSMDPRRRYQPRDMVLAEELARRAAIALEHARLYESALLANQAKSDFLAVMSHELRTPLTTIMGYTDLLLGGGLPDPVSSKAQSYVERIRSAAWHLLGLIEQILVYARLDVGRELLHPERLSVPELLADAAALIEPVAAERGLRFTVELEGVPPLIETDLTKVRQILLNLLSNAVKFTDSGEVVLGAHQDGATIVITVQDTGIGIAP
jgi:PAS domain S-box-containing protein